MEISGYRSLAEVAWEPGPLNLLIGANGSGKSNLLRALMLLRAAALGKLAEAVRREGGMVPMLWDGEHTSMELGLVADPVGGRGEGILSFLLTMRRLGQTGAFDILDEHFVAKHDVDGEEHGLEFHRDKNAVHLYVGRHEFRIEAETIDEAETFLAQARDPEGYPAPSSARRWFSGFRIYHDVRVDSESEVRRATVARLERQVDPDGSNLIAVLHTLYTNDIVFREDLNSAMRAAFGEDFEELLFPPAEDGRVQMRVRWKSLKRPQSAADLSDGTLRFLFLITVLANPTPPSLIAIDEPETGLHPAMLPIVAEYAVEASRRTQVILTTHSPQFLNAFSEYPDITTVAEWREGQTVLRRLLADKLAKWLEHYQLGELMISGELETME